MFKHFTTLRSSTNVKFHLHKNSLLCYYHTPWNHENNCPREGFFVSYQLYCLPSLCLQTIVSLFANTLQRRLVICYLISQLPFLKFCNDPIKLLQILGLEQVLRVFRHVSWNLVGRVRTSSLIYMRTFNIIPF